MSMSPTELESVKRVAVKLEAMEKALKRIQKEASHIMDKGNTIGAGRRLERIHIAASDGLAAYHATE